jgi:hypothetical protein
MFPDPTVRWIDYPSQIDGISRPPFVFDLGIHRGVLRLVVSPPGGGAGKHFRIEIDCQMYLGVEEMIYSIAEHGGASYGGQVYVKQATVSRMLDFWQATDPVERPAKHFLFVGGDFCYETLGLADPVIHAFKTVGEAYDWART